MNTLYKTKLVRRSVSFRVCVESFTMSWPTINKFNNIMTCKIKSKLLNTSKFIKEAMCLRKNTLQI